MTISPDLSRKPRLVIMLKEPRPGRVKTRLGADLGMTRAAWWFRHQVTTLLRRTTDPRWQTVLAVAPDHIRQTSRVWPAHFPRICQGSGDLGARMGRILRTMPPGPVCIIGGDIPGGTAAHEPRGMKPTSHGGPFLAPLPQRGCRAAC